MKICHLTSAHQRYDTRIFLKECCSLADFGYEVTLIVADGLGDEVKNDVCIIDVGRSKGKLDRLMNVARRILRKAEVANADVYHAHDPELLPVLLKLKRIGKKVIFDSHEDFPKQILGKRYLRSYQRKALSKIVSIYESYACRKFDAIIAATPFIRDKFSTINTLSVTVNNYPLLGELSLVAGEQVEKEKMVCYVGGIAAIRGIETVVAGMTHVKSGATLALVGKFAETATEARCKSAPGWERVSELGFVDRLGVRDILAKSVAGVVTFLPAPNHIDSQPNKMFEYMSAGIPVVASHFPLWKEIIEGNDCGVCVDPVDERQISGAIDFLVLNPERAAEMGSNGQRAVVERYNWSVEEKKLISLYSKFQSAGN